MVRLASSGDSAFQGLPEASRAPTSPGIRGLSHQARTSVAQRPATSLTIQASNASVGTQTGLPSASAREASRPAPDATSTSSAVVASSTWRWMAAAFSSRTPRPPLRSAAAGWLPQWSSSSSIRRTASKAAPAPARSTMSAPRSAVAISGAWGERLAGGPPAAQHQPDLARHDDGARGARHQQLARQQLLGRGLRVLGQHGVPGRCRWSPRRPRRRRARAAPGPRATAPRGGPPPRPASAAPGCAVAARCARPPAPPQRRSAGGRRRVTPRPAPGPATAPGRRRPRTGRRTRCCGVRPAWFDPPRRGHLGQRARAGSECRAHG